MKYVKLIILIFAVLNNLSAKDCDDLKNKSSQSLFGETNLSTGNYSNLKQLISLIEKKQCPKDTTFYKIIVYCISKEIESQNELNADKYFKKIDLAYINSSKNLQFKEVIYEKLADYYRFKRNKNEEIKIYERICDEFKNNSAKQKFVANAYFKLFSINFQIGDYEKAQRMILQCRKLATKSNDYEQLSLVYQSLAKLSIKLGQNAKIFEQLKLADEYAVKTKKHEIIGSSFRNKGYFLVSIKEYKEAINAFQSAFSEYSKINFNNQCALQYLDIGFLYYDNLKQFDKALNFYNKALTITDDEFIRLRLLDNIGAVYWKQKQYDKALNYYQKSLQSVKIVDFSDSNVDKNPSVLKIKNIKLKHYFSTTLEDKAICLIDYYKTSKNSNYLDKAQNVYLTLDKLIDYMRYEHTGTQSKYFWRNKTRSTYESAIETCYLLKDYEKAFYFFEKSRSVLLNDKLNELGAKQKLSEDDLQKEKDFQKQIAELNASIEKAQNTNQNTNLNNKLIDLQEQQDRFIRTLETKNPAYYQIKYDTTNYNLKQIQSYLGVSGGSLVEYFVGDSATYAIIISTNTVSLKKLSFNVNNTQQFVNLCSKKITTKTELSTFLGIGSEVYRSLISPLNLPIGHLIISQDGAFLPFEALSKSVKKPNYLLNDFMISYTYSAQFLLRNKPKNYFLPNNKFIGIAPVNFTQKLNTLNGSDKSIDNIAKSYFWSNQLIGQAGSKKAFLSSAKNYKIVQIYTHAFADSNETEPRIYFADSTLKVSDLSMEEQFKTNLLVLSACKTGVGKIAKGEGVLSLARGFSMAGIPSTITSLWSIEDRDTYTLTELFYKYIQEGLPKDEALQKAKIEFIASTENAMPNAWAGMVLVGDNSPLEKQNHLTYWILGGLLLGGIGFYFKQKSPQQRAF